MQIFSALPRSLFAIAVLAGLMAVVGLPTSAQSCDVYVDTNASGNGNGSQGSPYTNLQDGLDDAGSGEVVCVAEGTYNPPKKNTAFSMPGGSTLQGGYPSGFTSMTQDVDGNPTILDGANAQKGSSAKRILTLGSLNGSTLIDGVTIQNGNGDAGAGFRVNYNGSSNQVTFRDVTFSGNDSGSKNGGAVWLDQGNAVFERVRFVGNVAGGDGGAIYANNVSSLTFENTSFLGNEANGGSGGAFFSAGAILSLSNVLASGNYSTSNGGAISTDYSGEISMVNTTLSGNRADGGGGGIYIDSNNPITVENSIIWSNSAGSGRSQVGFAQGTQKPTYRYSDIQGSGGSGAWDSSFGTDGEDNIALNPIFLTPKQPSAAPTTSGDYHLSARSPAVDAGDDGAINLGSDLDGENRIQDAAVDMGPYEGSAPLPDPEILYVDKNLGSDQNGGTSWSDAVATLQAALDQASVNTEIWVADGVYYPDESPGGDSDDPTASFELKDRVSIYGGFAGNESSRSERSPEANLAVLSGDLTQDDITNGDGVVTSPSDQNSGSKNTPTNAYHVVDGSGVSSQTVVDGVTITAGSADLRKNNSQGRPDEVGGGVFINNGSPTLSNVRIVGNRANVGGGGIASYGGGGPVMSESIIESNTSSRNGGGIYNADGSGLRARFVTLRGNTADAGGGIYNTNSNIRFTNVTVEGNEATSGFGGGVYTSNSNGSILTNLRVVGNRAASGGGLFNDNGGGRITVNTSTFSGNYATNSGWPQGGGIYTESNENLVLNNSIVWGNGPDQVLDNGGEFSQQSSLIEGGMNGALDENPKFLSDPTLASSDTSTDGDLQLQPTSPASDEGDQTLLPQDVSDIDDDGDTGEKLPLDLAGGTRVRDGQVDMGAYEGTSANLTIQGTYGADGGDAGWYDFGVPVQGATAGDVQRGTGTGLTDVAKWGGWRYIDGSWSRLSDSDPLPAGRGLTAYFADKGTASIDPSMTWTTAAGSIVGNTDVTIGDGTPTGDGALSQGATWHLLSNPYPVPYDLNELNSDPNFMSDFQTTIHVWDSEKGSYQAIETDPLRPSQVKTGVSSWQAFFAERQPNPTVSEITFPNEGRLPALSNTNPYFGSKSQKEQKTRGAALEFKVVARTEGGEAILQDEAANLLFRNGATEGWDRYDATKLTPPTNKYVLIGPAGTGREASLTMKTQESLPLLKKEEIRVPLGLKTRNYEGPLTLSLSDAVSVPDSWTVELIDTKGTAEESDDVKRALQEGEEGYTFTVGSSETSTANTSKVSRKHNRPAQPESVDWTPLTASKEGEPDAKAAEEKPAARFALRITRSEAALPVEMAGFDAAVDGQSAQLKWKTASETMNAGFHVQHQQMAEGDSIPSSEKWSSLGFVEGAGSSNSTQQYRFETESLRYGTHAFRLRQVDTDGTTSFSDPIRVNVRLNGTVAIAGPYPNPVRQGAKLDVTVGSSQEVSVQIYDVLGRRVRTVEQEALSAETTRTVRIDTGGLSSGTYFLRVKGDQFRKTRRMTVVR